MGRQGVADMLGGHRPRQANSHWLRLEATSAGIGMLHRKIPQPDVVSEQLYVCRMVSMKLEVQLLALKASYCPRYCPRAAAHVWLLRKGTGEATGDVKGDESGTGEREGAGDWEARGDMEESGDWEAAGDWAATGEGEAGGCGEATGD